MTFQIPGEGGSAGIAETELGQLSEYYQMCRRYGIDYFEENPGNTVYHLVLENQNLLFTFCRRRNQYSIRYLAFGRKQMEEAWLKLYYRIPLAGSTACFMMAYKVAYYTEEYNIMYDFGGMRLMKYLYTDAEWDSYVESVGGTLSYE
jgi:hypothetical protein